MSSLIAIIETIDEKLVLKLPLSLSHAEGEAQFLRVWNQAGIKVPEVFEEGVLDGHSFILMEFIKAAILKDIYTKDQMLEKGFILQDGKDFTSHA